MVKNGLIKCVFTVSILWWIYLFFTTQIVIVFDAEGYEGLGSLIAHHGWAAYLRGGPQREPLFPGIIAFSMLLGDWFKISYFYFLKIIGLSFLWLTMFFSYRLMSMLAIRPAIAALVLLYMGISPVMTNSSIRLWSEFAAYPWVVLAVLWTIKSWKLLDIPLTGRQAYRKIAGYGMMLALMFLLIMSVKAVAEGVLLFYLWPFYWRIWSSWRRKNFVKAKQTILFCLMVLILFEGAVCAYKWGNYHYNGNFAFTNRGDWAFYGNTERRMEALTPTRLGAAIAFVPGLDVCSSHFNQDDCDFWSARHSDDIIGQKQDELNAQGVVGEAQSKYFIHSSIKMILSNPLQALLLMAIEAHKMFFWESSIAFVAYPNWLENILYNPSFIKTTKFLLAFFCWAGCFYSFVYFCCRFVRSREKNKDELRALFWVINFIFSFTAMYALFFILDRYSYPIISLYMVLIAFTLQKIIGNFIRPTQHRVLGWFPTPGVGMVAGVIVILVFSLWIKKSLMSEIIKEHQAAANKAKIMTISYYFPDFSYFSDIVDGKERPQKELMDGYHFGKPYIFHMYYQKGADLFPGDDSINFLLAYCDYYLDDLKSAQKYFDQSLQVNPYFFWAYYDMGIIYFQQGDIYQSVVMLTRSLSLNKQVTLEIIERSPFYRQIWRGVDDPPTTMGGNLDKGTSDAAILLAACYLTAKGYDQSLHIVQLLENRMPWHHDLWEQIRQLALNKQPMSRELFQSLLEQIPVRLF